MKWIFIFLVYIGMVGCSANETETTTGDTVNSTDSAANSDTSLSNGTVLENVYENVDDTQFWMDSLSTISFVKETNRYLDSLTRHRHGIAFLADSTDPTELIFTAGYNGPDRFETYYQFYVEPATKKILVYDPVSDKKLTIKQYKAQVKK